MVSDADFLKERMKLLIFSTPVGLHGKEFSDQRVFPQVFETRENFQTPQI
jgi:hypothetical protein